MDDDRDELFDEAARIVVQHQQGSTSCYSEGSNWDTTGPDD